MITIKQLLEDLNSYPKNLNVQLDLDGAIFEKFNVDKLDNKTIVISNDGESMFG